MNPKISVIMPCFNSEKYLHLAIDSILNQTFKDFELIIIDDCSTDNSWNIIQDYAKKDLRIIPIRNQENLKICKTLNKGIEISKGEFIARMDSDDISLFDRFEKQLCFLEGNPDIGIVGGSMLIINEIGEVYSKRKYNLTDSSIRAKIFRYSPFCHPVIMVRKNILIKSGMYDSQFSVSQDYDLYFRIGNFCKFGNLDDELIKYRMFDNNSTTLKLKLMEGNVLKIRMKATKEYGYKMSLVDKLYFCIQYISYKLLPGKFRIWLFNLLRNS